MANCKHCYYTCSVARRKNVYRRGCNFFKDLREVVQEEVSRRLAGTPAVYPLNSAHDVKLKNWNNKAIRSDNTSMEERKNE